jgi:hypothetical protein
MSDERTCPGCGADEGAYCVLRCPEVARRTAEALGRATPEQLAAARAEAARDAAGLVPDFIEWKLAEQKTADLLRAETYRVVDRRMEPFATTIPAGQRFAVVDLPPATLYAGTDVAFAPLDVELAPQPDGGVVVRAVVVSRPSPRDPAERAAVAAGMLWGVAREDVDDLRQRLADAEGRLADAADALRAALKPLAGEARRRVCGACGFDEGGGL